MGLARIYVIIRVMCVVSILSACASGRGSVAPDAYLQPAGWQNIEATLSHDTYAAYSAAVSNEVRLHRIAVVPEQAELEISMASPFELQPDASCGDEKRGIAILVHGLSDTAFAMRDIGDTLRLGCYVVRSILLPGHGTRAGDLLTTRYAHWDSSVQHVVDHAVREHDHVIVGGFSLGAVLTLNAAMKTDSRIDALLALSPAYHLSSWRLARWAPLVHPFKPWIDQELADDAMRYEAMPTRGIAETVRAIREMRKAVVRRGAISIPWLLVQSTDDAVVVPADNRAFFHQFSRHKVSRLINFSSDQPPANLPSTETWLQGFNDSMRVTGLTHQAIHISPDNPHYGINGAYRNCGSTAPRDPAAVALCESSKSVWYGLWNDPESADRASARSTFNPNFRKLSVEILHFLNDVNQSAVISP